MPLGEDDLATYAQRWQVPASTFGQDSEIAIGGGRAYAIRDYDTVAAYDVTSPASTPVWTRTISGDSFVGGTVLSGTTLYVQTQNGAIVALDASTGAVAWQGPVTGSAGELKAAPVVVGGRVVYPTDSTLVAVDIATHALAWSVAAPTYGSLATDGTRVYLWGKDSCALEAYRISDGGLAWSSTLLRAGEACVGPGGTGPVVDAGVVYSGTYYYGYHAFSATTGALLWSRRGTGGNDARLAVNENYLVSATGGQYGVIDVLDKQTGAVVYSGSAARSACGVTLVGDTALICPSSTLVAFDIVDRRVLWESGQLDYVDERPMVSGGRIYVRNAYGVLRAFGP
jgi:outer membrane protein assembly factor BamB